MHLAALIIVCAGLWLALSGHYTPLLLGFGAASVAFTAFLAHRLGGVDDENAPFEISLSAPLYWLWLLGEIGKANLVVIRAALSRDAAISPTITKIETHERTDVGRTTLANSITLTPGTVTIMIEDDWAEIHALTEDLAAPEGLSEMDERVAQLDKSLT